jgi:outer membrane biosynthesis protein TonB
MRKDYVYESLALHIAVVLLCTIDVSFLHPTPDFDDQPPIIVNLDDVKISDMTNLPEKAVRAAERKAATRKENPQQETAAPKQTEPQTPEIKEEAKPEPVIEAPEIKAPALIEEPKNEEVKEEPKKESKEPIKEKKKPAPIPQRKPQVKPTPKPEPKKAPEKKETKPATTPSKEKPTATKPNAALESLFNSVNDMEKEVGDKDAPAQVPFDEPVNNLGIEGGNKNGSYFSELSISGVDFVKSKIQESWKTIAGGKDDRNIKVLIQVKLSKEGEIISVDIDDMKRYRSDTYFQALADSAERAVYVAQDVHKVFKTLATQNSSSYDKWKVLNLTFTPLGLAR